jgi:hypothetical protein
MVPNLFAGMRLGMTGVLGVLLAGCYVSSGGIGFYTRLFTVFRPRGVRWSGARGFAVILNRRAGARNAFQPLAWLTRKSAFHGQTSAAWRLQIARPLRRPGQADGISLPCCPARLRATTPTHRASRRSTREFSVCGYFMARSNDIPHRPPVFLHRRFRTASCSSTRRR